LGVCVFSFWSGAGGGFLDLMASSFFGRVALVIAGVLFAGGVGMMRLVSRVDI